MPKTCQAIIDNQHRCQDEASWYVVRDDNGEADDAYLCAVHCTQVLVWLPEEVLVEALF